MAGPFNPVHPSLSLFLFTLARCPFHPHFYSSPFLCLQSCPIFTPEHVHTSTAISPPLLFFCLPFHVAPFPTAHSLPNSSLPFLVIIYFALRGGFFQISQLDLAFTNTYEDTKREYWSKLNMRFMAQNLRGSRVFYQKMLE